MIQDDVRKPLPFINVVVPVKNEEKYIDQCIQGLLKQDYPNEKYTIVVVDNGSTDGTLEILTNYHEKIVLLNKTECTIGALRNYGAQYCNSELVAFLDGDCVVPVEWLSVGERLLRTDKQISCVGFAMSPPEIDGDWVEKLWHGVGNSSRHEGTVEVDWLCSFNLLVKTSYFDQVSGFSEIVETGEDFDFGVRLNKFSSILFCDKISIRHLGNVHGAFGLFKKELWRGRGSLRNFMASSAKNREILSVFGPIAYLFILLFCLSSFWLGVFWFFLGFAALLAVPLFILYTKKMLNFKKMISGWFFFFIYLIARGIAAFV